MNESEKDNQKKPARKQNQPGTEDKYVVGIGTSAGGLQALHELFQTVPNDSMSYVVVQHLSPEHAHLLSEFLAHESILKVQEAEDGMPVEKNKIYVIPVNRQITIRNNTLYLSEFPPETLVFRTIDVFFKSLAADKGNKSIGIILSGMGADGVEGITAIKKAGGLVLVQDPETAKFDGMPQHAIQSGHVDLVLPPELMPAEIFNHVKIEPLTLSIAKFVDGTNEAILNQILELVHDRTGLDFANYKRPTIIRRISRRMAILKLHYLVDYLDFLQLHPEELETIGKEFLIGVTKFFRDEEAFNVIKQKVIPSLVEEKKPQEPLRFWVTGCSTGEEVYSLAILVREYLDKINKELEVKIFASDIDRDALEFAGKGLYPASSLTDVSPGQLTEFFVREEGKYRVCQKIRKMVIFAPHNIISDPPFSRMDLVSCRNMLIYLNPILQKKILTKFHYSLQQGGYLFLGSSESIGDMKNFVEVNKKWKIYRNMTLALPLGIETLSAGASRQRVSPAAPVYTRDLNYKTVLNHTLTEALNETFLLEFEYAAVFVDENFDVLHGAGDYNRFLTLPNNSLSLNLLKMVPADLALNLGTLLRKATREKEKLQVNNMQIRDKNQLRRLNLIIKPYLEDKKLVQKFILVLFHEEKPEPLTIPDPERYWYEHNNEGRVTELELELQHTKEDLQAVVEELETANEELQSTNEELISSNEELQSTNEELQSLNEELHTINAEHQYKIRVLTELDDDLNNYFRSTAISQIFLDRKLGIRKYTPAATRQINLIDSDIGRSIYQISNNLQYPDFIENIRRVVANNLTIEKEVQDKNGTWFQMRILPYLTQGGRIDGVIIIFVEIHELKNLQLLHAGILDSAINLIQAFKAVRNPAGQIIDFTWTMVNAYAQRFMNRRESEVIGMRFRREFPGVLSTELFDKFVQVVETEQPLNLEVQQEHEGKMYWFHLIAVKLEDGLVITLENITERKQAEQQLLRQAEEIKENAEKFRLLSEAIPQLSWTSHPDGSTHSYNERWFAYTGISLAGSLHWGWVQAIHPDDAPTTREAYLHAMQTGQVFERQMRICRHDGQYRWHLIMAVPVRNHDGQIILYVGTATDIHEHQQAVMDLEENRHFVRQVAETSPDFIYVFDLAEQKNVFLNRDLAQVLGYGPEKAAQSEEFILFDLMHPDDKPQVQALLQEFAQFTDNEVKELVYRVQDARGKIRWYRDRSTVFKRDKNNQPYQIVGIAQDVTDTIIAQEKLIHEKEFSEKLLDNSIDGIVAFDTKACITSWNVMMEVLNGILKEDVLGKNIFDLFPEYHSNDEGRAINRALNGEKTVLHDHPYGLREGYYETTTLPLFNDQGEVIGGLNIIHDITERKRLEDERINLKLHQQKEILNIILETQETERKRISEALHNGLGQLLYATKLKVNDMHPDKTPDKELQTAVDGLLDEAIKETRLLSFELMPSILRDFGLEAAIQEICKRVSSSKINLQCEVIGLHDRLDGALETAIFRICQELLNNVLKHSQASEASIQLVNQKTKLMLRVEDNGIGFDPQQIDLTGLGLSSIRNRLELIDGTLNMETEPGQGSRFTVKINKNKLK